MREHPEELGTTWTAPLFRGRYRLLALAGRGSWGLVCFAHDLQQRMTVALKFSRDPLVARNELRTYTLLAGIEGIPILSDAFSNFDHTVLCLEKFGTDLEALKQRQGVLPVPTVYKIGRHLVETLQKIHIAGVVHRDVKPANILLDFTPDSQPRLSDFGLTTGYRHPLTGQHLPLSFLVYNAGTQPFMSTNAHMRFRYSRRDDMESLAYTLIYLVIGSLPWSSENDHFKCARKKANFSLTSIYRGLPPALQLFLCHVRGLSYEEAPDYTYLMDLLDGRNALGHL
ncbi:kinase-like domain-containing protein [Chiua virens]|nr:kinase-like domain-containing protein [Chiua virens]